MNALLRGIFPGGLLLAAGAVAAAAPVANDDAYQVGQDNELSDAAPGVLENDTDADGDPLTAALVSLPGNGTVNLQADGSFTYTPQAGFFGTDSFSYEANDGTADSNVGVVEITVAQYDPGEDDSYEGGGSYGALSPWSVLLLALAGFYPRGLKRSKRRDISP